MPVKIVKQLKLFQFKVIVHLLSDIKCYLLLIISLL